MEKREKFGQIFIYAVLTIWFGTEVLFSSTIKKVIIWNANDLNDALAYFILALLMIQILFFQKYNIREIVIITIITFVIVLATLNSAYNKMMSTWIFIVAAKYIDFEKVARLSYYVELFATLLVFYLFFGGYIEERVIYRGELLRHSYGFSHPNQLGVRIFLLVVCRCYIRRKKFNILDWGLIVVSAFFVDKVSNSKTSYYALYILAIITLAHIILQKMGVGFDKISNLLIMIAIMCNIGSLLLSSIKVNKYPLLNKFDYFMSRRFSCCYKTMRYYGIKMFGQDVQLIINRPTIGRFYHFWLDNAYMSILLRYGPIVLAAFSLLYLLTMAFLRDIKEYMLVEILCLYAIYGIMENNFFSLSQNLFLLLLSLPIYKGLIIHVDRRKSIQRVRFKWG